MPTTVFFASNRMLAGPATIAASYSAVMQPASVVTDLTYGVAFVDGTDPRRDRQGHITSIENVNVGSFAANVAGDLSNAGRNLLVFVHGFDNTFEDAITRAAFNRDFLAASGQPGTDTTVLAFSWPSLGKVVDGLDLDGPYRHDQQMAIASGPHLMTFLSRLEPLLRAARANGQRTYLLAHSMGNLALQGAVESWFRNGNGDAPLFDVAILAAADCAFEALAQPSLAGLNGLSRLTTRISIYYSGADRILSLSQRVNRLQRLGQDGPRDRTNQTLYPGTSFRMFDAGTIADFGINPVSSHQYYRLSATVRGWIAQDMAPA